MTAQLKVVSGTGSGMEFQIAEGSTATFGRMSPANVRVHDPWCSRRHCQIRHADGELRVTDLGSRHGTFVNGQRIAAETVLESGDKLRIGRCEMLFTLIHAETPRPDPIPVQAKSDEEPLIIPDLSCPQCGSEVAPGAAACPECQAEVSTADDLPAAAFCCPVCDGEVTGDAPMCPHCETEFSESSAS